MSPITNLGAAFPEMLLAATALVLLIAGVFRKTEATELVGWLAIAALFVVGAAVVGSPSEKATEAFHGLFATDRFTQFAKVMILLSSAGTLAMALSWMKQDNREHFEYSILVLLATLGMFGMVSANSLMSLYLALELMSLPLYVLAAVRRDSLRSTEAGLKYFVLGAAASGLLLYGMSLVYGFTGTTAFAGIASVLAETQHPGVVVGLVFMLAGLAFKISAAPFHMWTPDVYEGSPTAVTAFFAVAPKVAALMLILRLLAGPFAALSGQWQQIVWAMSVASMVIGSFGAIGQTNIKRLMAYSSIGHMGYVLIGATTASPEGWRGALLYVAIYVFMNMGTFAVIHSMRQKGRSVRDIEDLAGLMRTSPAMAVALLIFMFSMAGLPPLAGFFAKLYVFMAAVQSGMFALAIIGVVTSVVSAFYYLRIVKIVCFNEPVEALDAPVLPNVAVMTVSAAFVLFFWVRPGILVSYVQTLTQVLWP